MGEVPPSQRWWQTVPGFLTALAAAITATTGLIVALHQTGVIGGASSQPSQGGAAGSAERAVGDSLSGRAASGSAGTASGGAARAPIALQAGDEVRLLEAVYTLLSARVEPDSLETWTLRATVRMTNNRSYDDNFWDDSFRLVVGGVQRAPTGTLNKLVRGHSSEEGDLEFTVPAGTTSVILRIISGETSRDIPLTIPPIPGR